MGGLIIDLIVAFVEPEAFGICSAVGLFVFFFRYARRIIHSLLSRMAPKGGGCLVNPIIVLLLIIVALPFLAIVSPILVIYSIARAFGLKKGVIDVIPWI